MLDNTLLTYLRTRTIKLTIILDMTPPHLLFPLFLLLGQLEARERLLTDMEEKAREKVESAERESFRLKGLLMHMEHVAAGLRSQGSEEKERLRQEHARLQIMQKSLEGERSSVDARLTEEQVPPSCLELLYTPNLALVPRSAAYRRTGALVPKYHPSSCLSLYYPL